MVAVVCLVSIGDAVVPDAGICVSEVVDGDAADAEVSAGADCVVTAVNAWDCIGVAVDAVAKDASVCVGIVVCFVVDWIV